MCALQISNQALADEKQRTDVLLARQYNLISLMAQHGSLGRTNASSLEEKTLGAWHNNHAASCCMCGCTCKNDTCQTCNTG